MVSSHKPGWRFSLLGLFLAITAIASYLALLHAAPYATWKTSSVAAAWTALHLFWATVAYVMISRRL